MKMGKIKEENRFTVAVVAASGNEEAQAIHDQSMMQLNFLLKDRGFEIKYLMVIPSEIERMREALAMLCDEKKVDLVLTLGAVGYKKTDIMPEATAGLIEKEVPGLSEALRYYGLKYQVKPILSRGISGIRRNTLIMNLPKEVYAIKDSFEAIIELLLEGLGEMKKDI